MPILIFSSPDDQIVFDNCRGHALSAQFETSNEQGSPGGAATVPESPLGPPVSFEQYSKDEAFKKSQKAAGLSYEEKVNSYLKQEQQYMSATEAVAEQETKTPMGGGPMEEAEAEEPAPPPLQEVKKPRERSRYSQ